MSSVRRIGKYIAEYFDSAVEVMDDEVFIYCDIEDFVEVERDFKVPGEQVLWSWVDTRNNRLSGFDCPVGMLHLWLDCIDPESISLHFIVGAKPREVN